MNAVVQVSEYAACVEAYGWGDRPLEWLSDLRADRGCRDA